VTGTGPGADLEVSVGVDLGGTGTRVVALDRDGTVRREATLRTPHDLPPAQAVTALAEVITDTLRSRPGHRGLRAVGVGIGATGPVDAHGIIRNRDTLPAFSDTPLTHLLAQQLGAPCVIDNDAVTAAVGEHRYGSGRDSAALLTVTLGTGIGVALLLAGAPVRAADGSHPEAGHITIGDPAPPCYCGLPHCWEQAASRTALDRLTGDRTADIAAQARAGDGSSRDLFRRYGALIGTGLATLLTIYRPDRVVLGGGGAQYLDLFGPGLHDALERRDEYALSPTIVAAELGSLAGAVGAAVLGRPPEARPASQTDDS